MSGANLSACRISERSASSASVHAIQRPRLAYRPGPLHATCPLSSDPWPWNTSPFQVRSNLLASIGKSQENWGQGDCPSPDVTRGDPTAGGAGTPGWGLTPSKLYPRAQPSVLAWPRAVTHNAGPPAVEVSPARHAVSGWRPASFALSHGGIVFHGCESGKRASLGPGRPPRVPGPHRVRAITKSEAAHKHPPLGYRPHMDDDRTQPEFDAVGEDTRPIDTVPNDDEITPDTPVPKRRWRWIAVAVVAVTLGAIVGASVSLAGGKSTGESPITSTSIATTTPSTPPTTETTARVAVTTTSETQPPNSTAPTTSPPPTVAPTTRPTTPPTTGAPATTIPPTVPQSAPAAAQG